MAGFFNLPPRSTKSGDKKAINTAAKSSTSQTISIKGGGGLMDKINTICATVNAKLGKFANDYRVIRDNEKEFSDFIDLCIKNGGIAIDTETTGLDPIMDKLVGLCLYTPGHPAVYVPVNHLSYITGTRAKDQLTEAQIKPYLQRLADSGIFIVMFNAVFDIRVILNQVGVKLKCNFDCYVASRLLNENEPKGQGGLKALHKKYVLQGKGDAFSFGNLFSGMPFSYIPIKTAYLYAAHDAIITWELYEFQRDFLDPNNAKCAEHGLQDVAWVFTNIEMPVVDVVVEMEQNGVYLDREMCNMLHDKYHAKQKAAEERVEEVCNMYKDDIDAYRRNNPGCLIGDKFNPGSPAQLAILLYDILKIPSVDKDKPRGTGEEILIKIEHKTGNPLCKAILELRGVNKLLSTYIDKIPEVACPKDGRVHCKFNQMGADTGRMSSDSPNVNWALNLNCITHRCAA